MPRIARLRLGTRCSTRWMPQPETCCSPAATRFADSRTSARSRLVAAGFMWARKMGCSMRLAWAFRNRRLAAITLAAAAIASAQTPIFDGKTLQGWDGDPAFWRVENGAIVGETKQGAMPKQNTFLIWRGGAPGDFEFEAEYRLTGGNSGIQYRSVELPDIRWAMKGYQADIDAAQQYTGQIYEERGRGFLALRGQTARVEAGSKPVVL